MLHFFPQKRLKRCFLGATASSIENSMTGRKIFFSCIKKTLLELFSEIYFKVHIFVKSRKAQNTAQSTKKADRYNTLFQNNFQLHEAIKKKETQRLTLYQGSPKEKCKNHHSHYKKLVDKNM